MIETTIELECAWFVARHPAAATDSTIWIPGELEFITTTFVTNGLPPDHLVTSARCVVIRGEDVLMVTDRDGSGHILPGGRREPGETLEETARREVREETGIDARVVGQVGVVLFEHRLPRPADYAYPYPHFIQVVFAAVAPPDAVVVCDDEWAESACFTGIDRALPLVPNGQQALLTAAQAATSG